MIIGQYLILVCDLDSHEKNDSREKCGCVMISVWAGWMIVRRGNVAIFFDTVNVISIKLCMLILFYMLIPLSNSLAEKIYVLICKLHRIVKQLK